MEFRHPSWFDDDVYDLLRARDVPMVTVDVDEGEDTGSPLVATASWGYLRLRRSAYAEEGLRVWADRIKNQSWNEAYVYLKHEDGSPTGPGAAAEMRGIIDQSA
jgi:uncharacterized protein YecE (DUF72 family)